VQALAIRLRLGVPQAVIDLRRLAAHRAAVGTGQFTGMLTEAAGAEEAKTILSLLDQLEAACTTRLTRSPENEQLRSARPGGQWYHRRAVGPAAWFRRVVARPLSVTHLVPPSQQARFSVSLS
jgi:hypothetical protein